jgi:hypothetical protein
MTEATFKVCDMYIKEERRHFCESLTSDERADKELFVKSFKEHILYSLLVLLTTGDEDEINYHLEELWDDYQEVDCTDENRCEECTHCVRTRPCECGECDVVGGTCEAQSKKYEQEQEDEGSYCETCDWHNGGEYDNQPVIFCDWTCKDCGVVTLSEEEENHPDMVGLTYKEKCQKWVEKWISEMKRDF